jgi:uncharacterized membrane protein
MERAEKVIEVNAPVEVVFKLYSDFEKFPEWMKSVKEVRRTGERLTTWTADVPLMNVEWEAETTEYEPNNLIAWRTVRGDIEMDGRVWFEETENGKTRMNISIGYEPPAGRLGSLVAHLLGNDPEQQIEEDFKRFARLAEKHAAEQGAQEEDSAQGKESGTRKSAAA